MRRTQLRPLGRLTALVLGLLVATACSSDDANSTGETEDASREKNPCCDWNLLMKAAVVAMAEAITPEFMPDGVTTDDATTQFDVIFKGDGWQQMDRTVGKCLSVGLETGRYAGVYNCQSAFEEAGNETGCQVFRDVNIQEYGGIVRRRGILTDDCPSGKPDENGRCAFNVMPRTEIVGLGGKFDYLMTEGTAFETVGRPWFELGKKHRHEPYVAIFKKPYANYSTGHAVFGYVAPFEIDGEFGGTTLALEYMADEPVYKKLCKEALE